MSSAASPIDYLAPSENPCPEGDRLAVYDKLRPFRFDQLASVVLRPKVSFPTTRLVGYLLYDGDYPPAHTALDQAFIRDPDSFEKHVFYGLHTYGATGSFAPDLSEVIDLVHDVVLKSKAGCVYVTSQHTGGTAAERHCGKTTIYIPRSDEDILKRRAAAVECEEQPTAKRAKRMTLAEFMVFVLDVHTKMVITEDNAEAIYRSLRYMLWSRVEPAAASDVYD